jgi:hypothetical protein
VNAVVSHLTFIESLRHLPPYVAARKGKIIGRALKEGEPANLDALTACQAQTISSLAAL